MLLLAGSWGYGDHQHVARATFEASAGDPEEA